VEMLCYECSLNMAVTAQDYRTGVQAKSNLHHPGRRGIHIGKRVLLWCNGVVWELAIFTWDML
jgi:hypothetical protein